MFKELTIQNFLSVGPEIKLDLRNRGVVGVFGSNSASTASDSNGCGKSAIFCESIVWCLFGQTLREISADDVVNSIVKKDCFVSLSIEEDLNEYEVIRTRKMSNAHKSNELTVLLNGQNITKGTNTDTQELVKSIIGMDYTTFTQSVLLSYGNKPFSQMSNKEKNEVFEDIINIKSISLIKDVVNEDLKHTSKEVEITSSGIEYLNSEIHTNEVLANRYATLASDFEKLKEQEVKALEEKKEKSLKEIKRINVELHNFKDTEKEYKSLAGKVEDKTKSLNSFLSEATKLEFSIIESRAGLNAAKASLQKQVKTLTSSANSLAGKSGSQCPECFQNVPVGHIESVLEAHEHQTQECERNISTISGKIEGLNTSHEDIKKRKETNTEKYTEAITADKEKLHQLNKILSIASALKTEVEYLTKGINQYTVEQQTIGKRPNEFIQLKTEANSKLILLKKNKKELVEKQSSFLYEKVHLEELVKLFSNGGIKTYVIENVLPFLEERTQFYSDVLTGETVSISFSTSKDLKKGGVKNELVVNAVNSVGSDIYAGNSAGEKQRIDLAIGWALGDLASTRTHKPVSIKICDEIFTHTDTTGVDNIIKLLNLMSSKYSSIFCITHDTYMQSYFNNTIKVVKDGNFSSLN